MEKEFDKIEYAKNCIEVLNAYVKGKTIQYAKVAPNFLKWVYVGDDIFERIGERKTLRAVNYSVIPFTSNDSNKMLGIDVYHKDKAINEKNRQHIIAVGIDFVMLAPNSAPDFHHSISYQDLFDSYRHYDNEPCGNYIQI